MLAPLLNNINRGICFGQKRCVAPGPRQNLSGINRTGQRWHAGSLLFEGQPFPILRQTAVNWSPNGIIEPGKYAYSQLVDSATNYTLYWQCDGSYLYAAMQAPTQGYVALGVLPQNWQAINKKLDSEMILGYIDPNGKAQVFTLFCTGPIGPHFTNSSPSLVEYGGKSSGGVTTIEFKRKLSAGHQPTVIGLNHFTWAIGNDAVVAAQHVA